jgi:hypothetical protein
MNNVAKRSNAIGSGGNRVAVEVNLVIENSQGEVTIRNEGDIIVVNSTQFSVLRSMGIALCGGRLSLRRLRRSIRNAVPMLPCPVDIRVGSTTVMQIAAGEKTKIAGATRSPIRVKPLNLIRQWWRG